MKFYNKTSFPTGLNYPPTRVGDTFTVDGWRKDKRFRSGFDDHCRPGKETHFICYHLPTFDVDTQTRRLTGYSMANDVTFFQYDTTSAEIGRLILRFIDEDNPKLAGAIFQRDMLIRGFNPATFRAPNKT